MARYGGSGEYSVISLSSTLFFFLTFHLGEGMAFGKCHGDLALWFKYLIVMSHEVGRSKWLMLGSISCNFLCVHNSSSALSLDFRSKRTIANKIYASTPHGQNMRLQG